MKRRTVYLPSLRSECDAAGAGSASVTHHTEKTSYTFMLTFSQLEKLKLEVDRAYHLAHSRWVQYQGSIGR